MSATELNELKPAPRAHWSVSGGSVLLPFFKYGPMVTLHICCNDPDNGNFTGKASAAKRKPHEPDWAEICKRGADEMRGQVLREGVSWTGTELKPWRIVRSVHGRINQVDLIVGDWIRTGSMRTALRALKYGAWKHHA